MQFTLSVRGPARRWLALLLVAPGALAQHSGHAPAPPAASAAAPAFESVFKGYQPFSDEAITPWPAANDTVGRIGGWRAYARQARESAPGTGPQTGAQPDPHAGHHKP